MKLKLPKESFVNNLLNPSSKLAENIVVTFVDKDSKIFAKTMVSSADNSVILLAQTPCDAVKGSLSNCIIPDCKTFLRLFSGIDEAIIELEISDNFIKYNNTNLSFKYHLLDESYIVNKKSISEEKLNQLNFDTTFVITKQKVSELIKYNSIVPDAEKIYFSTKDKQVTARIGDDQKANTNEIVTTISSEFVGQDITEVCPLNIQNILLFSFTEDKINVAYNSQLKIFKFYTSDLQYIISGLVK